MSHPIPSAGDDEGARVPDGRQLGEECAGGPLASGELRIRGSSWRYNKGAAYVPSPIAVGDYFYMVNDAGLMTCIDARDRRAASTKADACLCRRRSPRRRSRSTTRSC